MSRAWAGHPARGGDLYSGDISSSITCGHIGNDSACLCSRAGLLVGAHLPKSRIQRGHWLSLNLCGLRGARSQCGRSDGPLGRGGNHWRYGLGWLCVSRDGRMQFISRTGDTYICHCGVCARMNCFWICGSCVAGQYFT